MKHVGGPLWNERWLWRRDCSILIDNDHRAIKTCTIFAHSIKDVKFYLFILHFVYGCIIRSILYTEIKNSNGDTTSVNPESDAKKKTIVVQNESRVEPTILRFA